MNEKPDERESRPTAARICPKLGEINSFLSLNCVIHMSGITQKVIVHRPNGEILQYNGVTREEAASRAINDNPQLFIASGDSEAETGTSPSAGATDDPPKGAPLREWWINLPTQHSNLMGMIVDSKPIVAGFIHVREIIP
jgi:hypothetical protein